jgi:hypothetical protein
MHYRTSAILNFWQSYGHLKIAILYAEYMEPWCIGKSNTNNLPAPTDLTENPYGKIFFFNKFTTKAIGVGTRRAADPLWTGMRTRGLAHLAAPDSLLRF